MRAGLNMDLGFSQTTNTLHEKTMTYRSVAYRPCIYSTDLVSAQKILDPVYHDCFSCFPVDGIVL